jgi:energy-coupling factor transporter ATP-binding protein EcfA2
MNDNNQGDIEEAKQRLFAAVGAIGFAYDTPVLRKNYSEQECRKLETWLKQHKSYNGVTSITPKLQIALVGPKDCGKSMLLNAIATALGQGRPFHMCPKFPTRVDCKKIQTARLSEKILVIDTPGYNMSVSADKIAKEYFQLHEGLRYPEEELYFEGKWIERSTRRRDAQPDILCFVIRYPDMSGREIQDQSRKFRETLQKFFLFFGAVYAGVVKNNNVASPFVFVTHAPIHDHNRPWKEALYYALPNEARVFYFPEYPRQKDIVEQASSDPYFVNQFAKFFEEAHIAAMPTLFHRANIRA